MKRLNRMSVFIASPGDLNEERKTFHDCILEINRLKAEHLGLQLEALGWEDTMPGRGRPQAIINQEIESSDLFVLLLWKRWGTPTGEYSSGTEEEFEIAKKLNERSGGKPAIWLYFKKVPDDMMADPGPELQRVLNFRTRIEEERSFLYHAFDTPDNWGKTFKIHLAKWLDKQQPFEIPEPINLSSQQRDRIELSTAGELPNATAQTRLLGAAKVLRLRALEAARAGRFTDAEVLFASSLATYEDLESLSSYGLFLDSLGDIERAEQLFERLAQASKEAKDRNLLATAYANLGHIYSKRGDMKTASNYWVRASNAAGVQILGEPEGPFEFYSCFISYATQDQEFAERLYADLQANNVRCWFAPHDIQAGQKLYEQIDEAIRIHEKVLLILSADSIRSEWVKTEIKKASKRQMREKKDVLFPVSLVPFNKLRKWEYWDDDLGRDLAGEIREYLIPDFSRWKDRDSYLKAFIKLLQDLQAGKKKKGAS
jgi:tetratricopeptide (TPR) repeat protein